MARHIDFANLGFEDFRDLAKDPSLSRHQKVGFPDDYREGKEAAIFRDVRGKLSRLGGAGGTVAWWDETPSAELIAALRFQLRFVSKLETSLSTITSKLLSTAVHWLKILR